MWPVVITRARPATPLITRRQVSYTHQETFSMSDLPKVSHYGTIRIGDLAFDGVVLQDGTRGYVRRQLFQVIGVKGNTPVSIQAAGRLSRIQSKPRRVPLVFPQ